MIERRPIRQWFVDAPAGLGVLAIALVSSFVGINNMVISGEVRCDRHAKQTTTCTITTSHLTGSKAQTIERVKSAQVVSSKTSSREISGDQYRHRVWLSPVKDQSSSILTPLPIASTNKSSQEALAQQINQFLSTQKTHLSLSQTPDLQDNLRSAFIALLIISMGCWGCIFLIRGMD